MLRDNCGARGCEKPRKRQRRLCSMHAARLSRLGSLELPTRPRGQVNAQGYRLIPAPGHPTAHRSGMAFEQRVVLYDRIGPGEHPCNWCGETVTWGVNLQADHVDHDRLNNAPDNIVAACGPCNTRRNSRWATRQTHCRHGHEFTEENTYVLPSTRARQCRVCSRKRKSAYKKRNTRPCRGCGRREAPRGSSTWYCETCAADPMRAARNAPKACGKGHELRGNNLVFVRASSKSNRLRWRCQQCTREKSYAAFQKRRADAA